MLGVDVVGQLIAEPGNVRVGRGGRCGKVVQLGPVVPVPDEQYGNANDAHYHQDGREQDDQVEFV